MDWKFLIIVFGTIFVAELGDKTQLATMLLASDGQANRWFVFFGASLALIAASGLAVVVGSALSNVISERTLQTVAGIGFIAIGLWTLLR